MKQVAEVIPIELKILGKYAPIKTGPISKKVQPRLRVCDSAVTCQPHTETLPEPTRVPRNKEGNG